MYFRSGIVCAVDEASFCLVSGGSAFVNKVAVS